MLHQWANSLVYIGKRLRLLQTEYVPWLGTKSYLSIGSNDRREIAKNDGLTAIDVGLPLTINGSNKYYTGHRISIDVQGSPINPTITGQQIAIFSNSLFPGGTGSITGTTSTVDIGGPVAMATGGNFGAATGSVGASGTGTIRGVAAITSVHNAGATNAFTGDFWLASSPSSPPATVENAYAVRVRSRVNENVTFTNLRYISIAESSKTANGNVGTSYGIYLDDTINIGAESYTIFSTSTSPSKLAGDVHITDPTKGIILTSPDGTPWRITISDSGVISAESLGGD